MIPRVVAGADWLSTVERKVPIGPREERWTAAIGPRQDSEIFSVISTAAANPFNFEGWNNIADDILFHVYEFHFIPLSEA